MVILHSAGVVGWYGHTVLLPVADFSLTCSGGRWYTERKGP